MVQSYSVTLSGIRPLLMHADNMLWKTRVERWQQDSANKGKSIPGDDRTPSWQWIGSLYQDEHVVAIPQDAIMASLMGAGTEVNEPKPSKKTFKARTQSGMVSPDQFWPIAVYGQPILMTSILPLLKEDDFEKHIDAIQSLGFALDIRRARVGMSKHVRVRPVFANCSAVGVMNVTDEKLTEKVLREIFDIAGDRKGMLEWRPSAPKPGPFGRFRVALEKVTLAA